MPGKHKIAGVVVLFNSSVEVIDNIRTYLDQLDVLYAIDNSILPNDDLVRELRLLPKVQIILLGKNLGIAHAFNIGASLALAQGHDLILTMDDDSRAEPEMIGHFVRFLSSCDDQSAIGILSPNHCYDGYTDELEIGNREILTAISSGSLVSLRCYEKVGPFLEPLFIDYVDFEYCLRLREQRYKIFRVGDAVLYHQLGKMESRKILGVKVGVTHHSPLRLYYRTRNRFFVASEYVFKFPGFVVRDVMILVNEIIKILLFETNRGEKLAMMTRGFGDFLSQREGEYRPR